MNRIEALAVDPSVPLENTALLPTGAASSTASAVSWAAILAGAAGAAALSLILLILGTGLGLSAVSPWTGRGMSAESFGTSSILWVVFVQLAASGLGGYLAGRLRTRWVSTHVDEVYFRDTAHGFLAWAVASLATAALLGSAIGSIVGTGVQSSAAAVAGLAVPARTGSEGPNEGSAYFVDGLFRKDAASAVSTSTITAGSPDTTPAPSAEVTRIFANAVREGTLAPEDSRYVASLVAQRTGLSQADAEKRVTDSFTRWQSRLKEAQAAAREAADKARKAAAHTALWLFISLLIGAFIASLAATFGGRQRDL